MVENLRKRGVQGLEDIKEVDEEDDAKNETKGQFQATNTNKEVSGTSKSTLQKIDDTEPLAKPVNSKSLSKVGSNKDSAKILTPGDPDESLIEKKSKGAMGDGDSSMVSPEHLESFDKDIQPIDAQSKQEQKKKMMVPMDDEVANRELDNSVVSKKSKGSKGSKVNSKAGSKGGTSSKK
jgi:hypothetical protein